MRFVYVTFHVKNHHCPKLCVIMYCMGWVETRSVSASVFAEVAILTEGIRQRDSQGKGEKGAWNHFLTVLDPE